MNTIIKTKLLQALSLFLLSGLFWCCSHESVNDLPITGGEENAITLSVKVPSVSIFKSTDPKTYALSEEDENEVSQIAVLLFNNEGNFAHEAIFRNGSDITSNPDNSELKSFTIKVPEGTYDIVVLGNSNQTLNIVLSTINKGQPKAIVLNKLLLTNTGKWNATPGSDNYMSIPMWGEIADVKVRGSMSIKTPITLARMVAKIDVALTATAARESFNLQSIHLYNSNDQGQIVPDAINWSNSNSAVTAPSVPATANVLATPLVYDGTAITSDDGGRGISVINEIYTFEAAMGDKSTPNTNTCLIVGGIYGVDSQPTYYRINIGNTTGVGDVAITTYLPLLRNFSYKVNITKVNGAGFSTPEDAFKARYTNIEASIINWNETQLADIVFDGQYMLGVSQGALTFSREARTSASNDNALSIATDYPSGWKIEKIVNADKAPISWLEVDGAQTGVAGTTTNKKVTMLLNNTGASRTGYIHLSAGRLTYIVKVMQLHTAMDAGGLGFSITNTSGSLINELAFIAKRDVQPAQQQFKVNWLSSLTLSFANTPGDKPFLFAAGAGLDEIPPSGTVSNALGTKTYTILPLAITSAELTSNPFYERTSTIRYSVSDGFTSIDKTLTLRQSSYNIFPVVNGIFMMDGGRKSFGVRSNTPFSVRVKSDPDNVIALHTTSGGADISAMGTPVYFDIVDDMTNYTLKQKNVVVTISSPAGFFPDQDVTLNCKSFPQGISVAESNSYIIAPNGGTLLIPISRVNKSLLGEQLSANEAFTAQLVWTDNENKITPASNIESIAVDGSGPSSILLVKAGSAEGNAVVAIKNTSGKILWSWHIWVTDFSPSPIGVGKFMDRNLGAIGNTPGALGTLGLLYQWGRKDPFPGSASINLNIEPTLYTAVGAINIAIEQVSENLNFGNSVAKPATFYWRYDEPYDWFTKERSAQNDDLWGAGSSKTIYDPCPDGWRIPAKNVWSDLTSANFPWSDNDYGSTKASHGGFYPAAGYRSMGSGKLYDVGSNGNYFTAGVYDRNVYNMIFSYSSFYNYNTNRAMGFSVRCVKE